MLGASHAVLLGCTPPVVLTYDSVVFAFDPDVVSYWKFENDGADEKGTRQATITGSPELGVETIVDLDADGECIAWPGSSGVFAEAAHHAAHKTAAGTIVLTFQHDGLGQRSTLIAADANAATGGLSLEVLTDGAPRAYLRRQSDGAPVALVGQPGDVQPNEAYTLIFKWGASGLSMALWNEHGLLVRRVTNPLTDGVSGTSPIRFGASNADTDHHDGPYGRVIWLKRRISHGEEVVLAKARTIQHGGISAITLSPIHMWQDDRGNGELKITDNAIGGAIQSASGGTLPAFPITVDPTPYVTGAVGGKAAWSAQFRNTTKGSWSRLANGDLQFIPRAAAGKDNSEYRISDDGGATWSAWQTLETLVLDRSLTPGPYFLVEDYSGSNLNRLNAARDAAFNAGGGTVTTLNRGVVYTGITGHLVRPDVHYLGLRVKRPNSTHSPSGDECSPTGNGQGSGWSPEWHQDIFDAENAGLAGEERVNIVGCTFDGNSFKQALRNAFTPLPTSQYGRCWPGGRSNNEIFNIQHMAMIGLKGANGPNASDRAKLGLYGCYLFNSPADGFQGTGASDGVVEDCRFHGCFRGGIVFDFGNSMLRSKRNVFTDDKINGIGCGIDHEILGHANTWFQDIRHEDDLIGPDFDFNVRQDSVHVYAGCTIGPGLEIMAKAATGATVTWQGSAKNPRGTVYYHRKAPASSGEYPRSSIFGWGGITPHNATFKFVDQDFRTWGGGLYVYHEFEITPSSGETWEIQLGQTVDTSSDFIIWLVNCTADVGAGTPAGTYRLFRTVKALNTNAIVRLDGLTIGSGFELPAVRLNGQRLEYRNVAHEGFPGATIQSICPGAGQYVAL